MHEVIREYDTEIGGQIVRVKVYSPQVAPVPTVAVPLEYNIDLSEVDDVR